MGLMWLFVPGTVCRFGQVRLRHEVLTTSPLALHRTAYTRFLCPCSVLF